MLGYTGFTLIMFGACFMDGESIAPGASIILIGLVLLLMCRIKESTHDRKSMDA